MPLFIGIDLGTQGTKAALHRDDGTCLAESFVRSRPRLPAPGVVEEDTADQLQSVLTTIRNCVVRAGAGANDIAGLAIAGQMAGIVGIDERGEAVTPYDSWLDTRCAPCIGWMRAQGDEVLRLTGNAPSLNHGPKILWWQHEHPDAYARIRAFVQPASYVAMRLGGLDAHGAFIDPTYLHFSGFADNAALCWHSGLCERFDVNPAKLPRIVASTDVIGSLIPEMASACGLTAGTPIVAGCGDTAASFLACGAAEPGVCVDVAGTASVFGATTTEFLPDTQSGMLGCGRSALPGLWHPYAYINGGGQNLEWFRTAIAGGRYSFAELDAAAAALPDNEGAPYFIPHLGGRVSPPQPGLRGAWAGISWNADTASLFRSVLEGVALEYVLYREAVRRLRPDFTVREVRITGGGEKSAIWNRLKADRLQSRVVGIECGGGASRGAALLAAVGTGAITNAKAALPSWVKLGAGTDPEPQSAPLAARRAERYAALLSALETWSPRPN